MFDPTAFDNMKVVIEGAFYDLDAAGVILIIDRNDFINLSKMSRHFEVEMKLSEYAGRPVTAKFILVSSLENIAAELLPGANMEKFAGCGLSLQFFMADSTGITDFPLIVDNLQSVWGDNRKIALQIQTRPLENEEKPAAIFMIEFNRIITEQQMDNLVEISDYMIETLRYLQSL